MNLRVCLLAIGLTAFAGCGGGGGGVPGDLPPLHPVKGKVVRGGAAAAGGSLRFTLIPETPESRDLIIVSELDPTGSFELSTIHALSQKQQKGAPAGNYQVTFTAPLGDQTAGGTPGQIVVLPAPYTVKPEANEFTIDLAKTN